ncbi:MAG: hypothetical protein KDN18_24450, partial [Verrucomicrobiae bacterium]|nr:hypothetical protein [Verrucomicrobiae bacterium]
LAWDAVPGAESYEVWSGLSADPASLVLLGSTVVANFLHAATAGETNHYAIRALNAEGPGSFSDPAATTAVIPLPDPRPDLSIGRSATLQRGVGVYNQSGAGQRFNSRIGPNRLASAHAVAGNDGVWTDSLILRSSPFPRRAKTVVGLLHQGGRQNITAALRSGGFATESLSTDESVGIALRIRALNRFGGSVIRISGSARETSDTVVWRVLKPN